MPLDPIVSLSVALAEAPGTCAFLLGSGVSRDAGVPTGSEVRREGLQRLRQLEAVGNEGADDGESRDDGAADGGSLDAWLEQTGRAHITYSELLQEITPDPAVRRTYLAGLFEGRNPGPTHEALARLAKRGLVRVFVTTNFDRLLEDALREHGIDPVVIASDADLKAAMPREHAGCYVLKPHGDYQRETIRNTPEEVDNLEPAITAALREIFSRYGVVVLGYSGSDTGIARALRGRSPRFGVWWVARSEPTQPAAELIEATAARVVRRDTAAEFVVDLEARVAVFEDHPTGVTPGVAHDGVLQMLQADDTVGVAETIRKERNQYETELERVSIEARERNPGLAVTEESIQALWDSLRPVLERRVASLLPLALYDAARFAAELGQIARSLERRQRVGGVLRIWTEIAEWSAAWLGYVCGALLVRLDRFEALHPLLATTWTDADRATTNPLVWLPSDLGESFGRVFMGTKWISPAWEFLTRESTNSMDWMRERYPELFRENEPRGSMSQFDVVLCIHYGMVDHRAVPFFSLGGGASTAFALRMNRDSVLRVRVADALGLSLEDFDASAPGWLREAGRLEFGGGFATDRNVAGALESGETF